MEDTANPRPEKVLAEKQSAPVSKKHGGARANSGGKRPGAGRKKGVPNKITTDVKEAIMAAVAEAGGHEYLSKVANSHPQVFCALLGKILPVQAELSDQDGVPLIPVLNVTISRPEFDASS